VRTERSNTYFNGSKYLSIIWSRLTWASPLLVYATAMRQRKSRAGSMFVAWTRHTSPCHSTVPAACTVIEVHPCCIAADAVARHAAASPLFWTASNGLPGPLSIRFGPCARGHCQLLCHGGREKGKPIEPGRRPNRARAHIMPRPRATGLSIPSLSPSTPSASVIIPQPPPHPRESILFPPLPPSSNLRRPLHLPAAPPTKPASS
jgi:hypothetical protein